MLTTDRHEDARAMRPLRRPRRARHRLDQRHRPRHRRGLRRGRARRIVLNGFGDRSKSRTRVEARTDARCRRLLSRRRHVEGRRRRRDDGLRRAEAGGVDILVNNAGIQHVAPIEEFPAEKWDAILAINLSSAFHAIRAGAAGHEARAGWGRIINVASAHGLVASPFKSAYVAAKHGMVGLTKVVALEAAEDGITCNAICPGYVWTPLVEKQIDDQAKAHNIPREQVIRDVLLDEPAEQALRHGRGDRRARRVPVRATPPPRSPARRCRSMAAGPRTERRRHEGGHAMDDDTRPPCATGSRTARSAARRRRHAATTKTINLALQGGGAHGAFTWGVLDRLLEDERIAFEGDQRHQRRRHERRGPGLWPDATAAARARKRRSTNFWRRVSARRRCSARCSRRWLDRLTQQSRRWRIRRPIVMFDIMTRVLSPYQFNPLNYQSAARRCSSRVVDFETLRAAIARSSSSSRATNVRTGKVKVFAQRRDLPPTRCWPRPACPSCSRRSRSTASTIGTAAIWAIRPSSR